MRRNQFAPPHARGDRIRGLVTRSLLAVGLVIAAVATAVGPAGAEVKVEKGKPVPEFHGKKFFNTEKFTLKSLRGKVLILQLSHTTSKPGAGDVEHLNKAHEKHGEKGLAVVCLFEETSEKVEAFVTANKPEYAVVAGCVSMRKTFGLKKGFPTTYVVNPAGNVVWVGNFADKAVSACLSLLKKLADRPWLPQKYQLLTKKMEEKDWAEVRKLATAALADDQISDDARERLTKIRASLETMGKDELKAALDLLDKNRLYEAREALRVVAEEFRGLVTAEAAGKVLEKFKTDKKSKREIAATEFLLEIFPEAQALQADDPKKAAKVLKRVVTKFRGTYAAKRAQTLIDRLVP